MKFLLFLFLPLSILSQTFGEHTKSLYNECELKNILSYSLFQKGLIGYYNLQLEKRISGNHLIIVDFRQASKEKRFYIIDLLNKKLVYRGLVAHGQKSGKDYPLLFSNIKESHQSSLGFYVTAEMYVGSNGVSLRLDGLDPHYNSNARERQIVLHGAHYVNSKNMGRSFGCVVLPLTDIKRIVTIIKEGNCLFIYAHDYKSEYLNVDTAEKYYDSLKLEEEFYNLLKP